MSEAVLNIEENIYEIGNAEIKPSEITNPGLFLETDRGQSWISSITDNLYYTRWFLHQGDSLDSKTCNTLAGKILEAKYNGCEAYEIEDILTEGFGEGHDAYDEYYESHHSEVSEQIHTMIAEIEDLQESIPDFPTLDFDTWEEVVKDYIIEKMVEQDDSSVMDMISSQDKCEIIIKLHDEEITANSYCDFSSLCIDENLQQGLAFLGYSIKQYREASGNKEPSQGLKRFKIRNSPIVPMSDIKTICEESSTTYFNLVIYGIVPLSEIINLDVTKPFAMNKYHLASYSGQNGTFFDLEKSSHITIFPGECKITTPWGYSPENICGLYRPAFYVEIKNID